MSNPAVSGNRTAYLKLVSAGYVETFCDFGLGRMHVLGGRWL